MAEEEENLEDDLSSGEESALKSIGPVFNTTVRPVQPPEQLASKYM